MNRQDGHHLQFYTKQNNLGSIFLCSRSVVNFVNLHECGRAVQWFWLILIELMTFPTTLVSLHAVAAPRACCWHFEGGVARFAVEREVQSAYGDNARKTPSPVYQSRI
jgi:hypothetical protein